jgi:cytochrome P450
MPIEFVTNEPKYRLTARRDREKLIAPDRELVKARDDGDWPVFECMEAGVHTTFDQAVAVCAYSDVRQMLGHPALVSAEAALKIEGSRANQPGILLFKDGEEHRRLRMMVTRHFTVKRVAAMRPRVEELVDVLLDHIEECGGPIDLVPTLTTPLPALVFCELMGVPYDQHEKILELTDKLVSLEATIEENHEAGAGITEWMMDLVRTVKKNPGADLMSAIITDAGDNLTEDEAAGLGSFLMTAGMETTSRSTALSILSLLQLPAQLAIVRRKDGLSETDADELIRYLSPAQARMRLASEEIQIGHNSAKAGERVMVSLLAANWDPSLVGESPDLNLDRIRTRHVGFGFGPHQCPGQHLARLELSVAITKIFERFPDLKLSGDPHDFGWRSTALIYGCETLPVEW